MTSNIQIINPGILSTIQFEARYGLQNWGISPGGPMDVYHAQRSNVSVGNNANQPLIEISHAGIQLSFSHKALICVSGPEIEVTVNNISAANNISIPVEKNDVLKIHKMVSGNWAYLAISGDLIVEPNYTNMSRILKKGDVIGYVPRFISVPYKANEQNKNIDRPIRILKGPEGDILEQNEWMAVYNQAYRLSPESNRMALKLSSSTLFNKRDTNISSSGVVDGTVQLLPDGNLVVLMRDRQTTGGYARIGVIHDDDISRLSQMGKGQDIYFEFFKNN